MTRSKNLIYLTRIEKFCASHRLFNVILNEKDNIDIFGKCNNCHGHNYTVEITVKGTVDPISGMVINITILKKFIQDILDTLDHKNLDIDVSYFHNVISTTENVTIYIWNELLAKLESLKDEKYDCKLHEVKVFETDKNICIYRGEFQE